MKKIKNIEKIRMSKGKESAISYSQKPSFLVSVPKDNKFIFMIWTKFQNIWVNIDEISIKY